MTLRHEEMIRTFFVHGSDDQTVVVPDGQEAVVEILGVQTASGGALSLELGPSRVLSLGDAKLNDRLSAAFPGGVVYGDPGFDVVLRTPADGPCYIGGYLRHTTEGE